jgi:hypothetical protein
MNGLMHCSKVGGGSTAETTANEKAIGHDTSNSTVYDLLARHG